MLLVCILIGIYFGFYKVPKNVREYLIGDEDMTIWPVAISLVVSYISAITFLGLPAEVYVFGIQYFYIELNDIFVGFIGNYIYLPVFMDLKLTSTYEYLERRFDKSLRRLGSFLYIFDQGGIRAVIWTDFLQAFFMISSMLLVLVKATWNIGGFGTVIERNVATGRLHFPDIELSLTKRLTLPTMIFGGTFSLVNDGILKQSRTQRYVALPTINEAKTAFWLFLLFKAIFIGLCTYAGLIIFATYLNCDPVTTNIVSAKDQLLPLLVVDSLKDFPGASGLFLAGVLSASLSSLSGSLNSLAAVFLEDCFKPIFKQLTPKQEQAIVKTVVFVIGILTLGLASTVAKLGQVFQLHVALGSVSTGPLLGVFTLGIIFPWANAKGAFYAGLSGLLFMSWICFGAQSMLASGRIRYPVKPVFTDGCSFNITETLSTAQSINDYDETKVFFMYRITFMLYTAIGTIFTIILGLIISYFTGFNKIENVDPLYLAPFVRSKNIQNNPTEKKRYLKQKDDSNVRLEEAVELLELLNKRKD